MKVMIEQIIELAKEAEKDNPIPWELVNLDRDYSWEVIATDVYELYLKLVASTTREERELVFLSIVTNLTMQNFVLNVNLGLMD